MTDPSDLLTRAAQLSKFLKAEHGDRTNDEMPEVRAYWLHLSYQTVDALRAEVERLQAIESALIDFLDALVIAKRNDDVMSVVDAMLAVHVEAEINRAVSPTPTETEPSRRSPFKDYNG